MLGEDNFFCLWKQNLHRRKRLLGGYRGPPLKRLENTNVYFQPVLANWVSGTKSESGMHLDWKLLNYRQLKERKPGLPADKKRGGVCHVPAAVYGNNMLLPYKLCGGAQKCKSARPPDGGLAEKRTAFWYHIFEVRYFFLLSCSIIA